MVAQARPSAPIRHENAFDMRALRQLAFWGVAASGALLLAVLAAFSGPRDPGAASPAPSRKADAQRPAEPDPELRRLAEIVHVLATDRERLVGRISAVERSIEDMTGAIKRQDPARQEPTRQDSVRPDSMRQEPTRQDPPRQQPATAPASTPATPSAAAPAMSLAPQQPSAPSPGAVRDVTASEPRTATRKGEGLAVPAIEPVEEAAAEIVRTEIGVDVGGATNFEGLRTLWNSTRSAMVVPLEGLYPVVAVRENSRTSGAELRLLVGPIASVEAAARLCATLMSARRYCQPVAFEGQRLADLDGPSERKPKAQAKAAPKQAPQPPAQQKQLPRLF